MKRREIEKKFDEIIDFSGVEKFLDTPLKHYSSGMQLRLAFSVAAFLEPEILVIDEVLAVGDAEFQKKCLSKMQDVSKSGRTILFVSHNLVAVGNLCTKAILLTQGKLIDKGLSHEIINTYLSNTAETNFKPAMLGAKVVLEELTFENVSVVSGEPLRFKLSIDIAKEPDVLMSDLCLLFYNYKQQRVAVFDLRNFFKSFSRNHSHLKYSGIVNNFNLIEGKYYVGIFYGLNSVYGDVYDLVGIQVKNAPEKYNVKPYDPQYRGYVELC